MLFVSYTFIFLFLPLTLVAYLWVGQRVGRTATIAFLTAASLVFYGYWKIIYIPLLLASVSVNYALGVWLRRQAEGGASARRRKLVLAAGVAFNLGLLGYYKYANFFVTAVNELARTEWHLGHIVLPLAISFFTFQQIAYLTDTYRGEARSYSLLQYLMFVTFFPQLIAGPIIKHSDTLPQINDEPFHRFRHENLALGLTMFIIGFFKKIVIADHLAGYADPAFELAREGLPVYFFEAWGATFAYTFQLYFDFSGYSDMAIGLGRIFGIRLPLNFNRPFRATSILEIWRLWHITLHRFLRDNLYIPLGGNRKGWWRRAINAMFTMLMGGIWHGAGWTFILFGGLHSLYMLLTMVWHYLLGLMGKNPADSGPAWRWTARALTFTAFAAGCMIFRADSLDAVFVMAEAMLGIHGFLPPELTGTDLASFRLCNRLVFPMSGYLWVLALLAQSWAGPSAYQIMRDHQPGLPEKTETAIPRLFAWLHYRPTAIWAGLMVVLAVLAVIMANQPSPFIYFQF
jgi:D-alanyl-lipoteichoic acid acyltransferase DltB (MBOAT superfamily)